MLKVKICGLTNLDDTKLACKLGADAVGFIFYNKSPRFVAPEKIRDVLDKIPTSVVRVGVFVNHPIESVRSLCEELSLDFAQLHGDESADYCAQLGFPFIKVFRVGKNFKPKQMAAWQDTLENMDATSLFSQAFLLDTYRDHQFGGTGVTFDWEIARQAKAFGRLILSGGLDEDNVANAVREVMPYAVDVCSGVELEPGKKDPAKLTEFFRQVNIFREAA